MRPLDRLPSIKLKLGAVILAAVLVSAVVSTLGFRLGIDVRLRPVIAAVLSLGLVQVLSRGMTSPLRAMARAAEAMAAGDTVEPIPATSNDEVGHLARAFNEMTAQLAAVDRERRDLVANVSHELRTPIGALRAMLENLVDGVAPPDQAALRTMLGQVERLSRLIGQLLDLSRLESGAIPLQRERFDVRDLLERAADECRVNAPDVDLRVTVDPSCAADGDAERVHQVVANLLENAVRFSPPSGVVHLSGRTVGGCTEIEVLDEGPGIDEADVDRVFERFYRADASRSSAGGGAGLGLAIARWIVDLHGGDIRAERRQPRGCRVAFTIPDGDRGGLR
jgi:signal transduction histidine kinase